MKTPFAFDTSALISLGYSDLFSEIIDNFDINLTEGIIIELEQISSFSDDDAEIAEKWLSLKSKMTIMETDRRECGEEELFEICKAGSMILVTDDVNAIKRFQNEVKCFFSAHIIYILFRMKIITKTLALVSIDNMKTNRDWKSNIISATAQTLFENDR